MTVAEASRQYQATLEAHRTDPDDEDVYRELQQARSVLDDAWVRHTAGLAPTA